MKPLLFGSFYLGNEGQLDMARSWLKAAQRSDCSELLVDSGSPTEQAYFLCSMAFCGADIPIPILRFEDNIGHLGKTGRDGWGRAFCKGMEFAHEMQYTHAVFMEGDLISRVSVRDMLACLDGKAVAAPWCPQVDAIETGLMAFDLSKIDVPEFIAEYNWESMRQFDKPEKKITRMLGDNYRRLDWPGGRNDNGCLDRTPLESMWYLTHVSAPTLEAFARLPMVKPC